MWKGYRFHSARRAWGDVPQSRAQNGRILTAIWPCPSSTGWLGLAPSPGRSCPSPGRFSSDGDRAGGVPPFRQPSWAGFRGRPRRGGGGRDAGRDLRQARLCAYVPIVEGFGLPVVESMAQGTPSCRAAGSRTPPGTFPFEVDPTDTADDVAEGLVTAAIAERRRTAPGACRRKSPGSVPASCVRWTPRGRTWRSSGDGRGRRTGRAMTGGFGDDACMVAMDVSAVPERPVEKPAATSSSWPELSGLLGGDCQPASSPGVTTPPDGRGWHRGRGWWRPPLRSRPAGTLYKTRLAVGLQGGRGP